MRIAHISPYDHQVAGGVREHVINLDRQMRAMGHEVVVIAPASKADGLAPNVIRISGWVAPVPGSGSIARISPSPLVYCRMRKILRDGCFDVVHLHEPLMPVVSLFGLLCSQSVTIGTIHGYRDRYIVYELLKPLLGRLMKRLRGRIAVSVDAERWVDQYFPGDYRIISDGVDVSHFGNPNVAPIPRFAGGTANILFVGRLEKRKGFGYLLRAFPAIKRAVPEARLIVVGHYDDRQARPYVEYARYRGLQDVEFIGPVSTEDLPRYHKSAQVFCAPSTGFEALGIVLLEAMAAGTPVVTTNIEGYRTVVTHEQDALVVPPRSSAALGQAIIRLLREPELGERLVMAGRGTVEAYAWPVLARRIITLYEECLAER